MSFPQYKAYGYSGIRWCEHLPEHWSRSRLGFVTWVRARLGWKGLKAEEYVEDGFVLLSTPNIKGNEIDFENVNYISEQRYEESPEIKLSEGDVLLAKDGSTLGTVNVVRSLPRPATVNSSIAVLTPTKAIDSVYLHYIFQSQFITQTIETLKGGMGVPHLFQSDIVKIAVPLPTMEEQHSIAEFLDAETSKIDALVAEQRRLIELLKEKRQAVISNAVTKGPNPHVKMKPSGIDWLGDVPEHWEVQPIYARYEQVLGKMLDQAKQSGINSMPYLRNIDVQWDFINISDLPLIDIRESEIERFTVKKGDLLVCEGGEVGRSAIWWGEDHKFAFQKAIHRLRPLTQYENPRYLFYVMKFASDKGAFLANSNPNTIPHLTGEQLRLYRFPKPPISEQEAIVKALDKSGVEFSSLLNESEKAISLLQERRTALISAAVTGKIDVRGFVPKEASA